MKRSEALARRNQLASDPVFLKKLQEDPIGAQAEIEALARDIVGTPDAWQKAPPAFGREHDERGHEKATDYSKFD